MERSSEGGSPAREVLWPTMDRLPHEAGDDRDGTGSERADLADLVRLAVERELTPKQREVVELTFFEGLTERAIAERLGVSQQVVHKRLHGVRREGRDLGGALRRLRTALLPLARSLGVRA